MIAIVLLCFIYGMVWIKIDKANWVHAVLFSIFLKVIGFICFGIKAYIIRYSNDVMNFLGAISTWTFWWIVLIKNIQLYLYEQEKI